MARQFHHAGDLHFGSQLRDGNYCIILRNQHGCHDYWHYLRYMLSDHTLRYTDQSKYRTLTSFTRLIWHCLKGFTKTKQYFLIFALHFFLNQITGKSSFIQESQFL